MPLLKQAIKYGSLAYAARSVSKGLSDHKDRKSHEEPCCHHAPQPDYARTTREFESASGCAIPLEMSTGGARR